MSEGVQGIVWDISGFMRIREHFEGFLVWKDFSKVRGKFYKSKGISWNKTPKF